MTQSPNKTELNVGEMPESKESVLTALLSLSNKNPSDFLLSKGLTPSVNYDNNVRRVCAYIENIILSADLVEKMKEGNNNGNIQA